MSKFREFSTSKAGRNMLHAKRQRRRLRMFIEGIEPQSKKMSPADRSKLQTAIAEHMSRWQRTAFTGDIALKLELRTTMQNAPQAHTIAKNLLDLFSVTGPDVEWPRRHLLYKDDKQIQVLSVSCSHGCIDPSIYVEVAPLAVMLEELEIAARESREDEMCLESLYQEDIAQDRIADFRDLVFNEKKSREIYGKHYESILKFSRGYAQSALLKQAGLNITMLNWLYEDPLNKTMGLASLIGRTSSVSQSLGCSSASYPSLPEAPRPSKSVSRLKLKPTKSAGNGSLSLWKWLWHLRSLFGLIRIHLLVFSTILTISFATT